MTGLTRLGLVVGHNETWSFIRDLYDDWQQQYQVNVFQESAIRLPFFRERLIRWQLYRDLAAFLAAHDVIFFEWASELLAIASQLPKRARLVTRLHRYEMYEWVEHVNWNAVDRIILVSKAKRQEFLDRFPEQFGKCHVVPEAVNLSQFSFRPKPFAGNIGILCHLSPRKRVYELILAFHDLTLRQPGLQLHIGGGYQQRYADYYFAITDIVRRLGLEDCVTFDGPVTDTAAWYKKIDIYISNGYSEGLQVSPMEAMASGCYTLSHWWAGADELLPPENLYFTDAELQQRIADYISLPEAKKQEQATYMRSLAERRFDVRLAAPIIRTIIDKSFADRLL